MMAATPQTIGGRVEMARVDAGLSQRELAERANVSERTIRYLEAGKAAQIGLTSLGRVLAVLGYRLTYEKVLCPADGQETPPPEAPTDEVEEERRRELEAIRHADR